MTAPDDVPGEPLLAEPPVVPGDLLAPAPTPLPSPVPVPAPDGTGATVPAARHRGRWLVAAAVLAVLGAGALVAGVATRDPVEVADGAAPAHRVGTPVLSARRVPDYTVRPVAARAVQASAGPVVARAPVDSCIEVRDGEQVLVDDRADRLMVPGSNLKLLTAAAARAVLGPDTRLTTRFAAASPPAADGTVAGDLYVVGGGDPLLATATAARRWQHGAQPTTSLEAAADRLVAAGVRRITGSVAGDASRYDADHSVPDGNPADVASGEVANLSALMVNDAWTVDPIDPKGAAGGAAPDPALHAAQVMTALLRARGVQVDGPPTTAVAPAGAATVLDVPSLPVSQLVDEMLTFSDNTTAEMLLKELGKVRSGTGSSAAGAQVLRTWVAEAGLPAEGIVIRDGSGLSYQDRLTCRLLGAVLRADGPDGPIAAGLPRPGRPGTLDDRFTGADLRDRVRAKTGTLRVVTALSGWLTTAPGRPLQFSILENPQGRSVTAADRNYQGDVLRSLLAYPQTPPADQLGPRPPVAT